MHGACRKCHRRPLRRGLELGHGHAGTANSVRANYVTAGQVYRRGGHQPDCPVQQDQTLMDVLTWRAPDSEQ
jgi:hypothetical protein